MKTIQILAVCVLFQPAIASADHSVDRTIAADSDATIEIESVAGSLHINGWDKSEIRITGSLGDDAELTIEGDRDHFQIEVEVPGNRSNRKREIEADLELWVPAGSGLEIETISAPITISGLDSWLEIGSVSGSIEASGSFTEVSLESVSGAIELSGSNTVVEAESVSGAVHLEGIGRAVDASTVSGTITAKGDSVDRASFESVAGSIEFEGSLTEDGRLEVECHSANVVVVLPGSTSAAFEVSTYSGNIDSEFGGSAKRTSRYAPGEHSEFSTGDASGRVTIETFSGNVTLKRR